MPSLLEKVNESEAKIEKEKKPEKKRLSAVKQIANSSGQKDKQISAKVNAESYEKFTRINKAQGLSNNSALNMVINKYVRENIGIIE